MVLRNTPAYFFHVDLWWVEAPGIWYPIYWSCIDSIHQHFSVWGQQDSSHFKLIQAWIGMPLLRLFQALVEPIEGHLFGIFFLLLWLFPLCIVAFEISTFCFNNTLTGFLLNNNSYCEWKGSKKKYNWKVANSLPGQYVTQTGMLGASPHCGRQTPSVPPSLLWQDSTWENGVLPRPQRVSQEVSTPPQHSDELKLTITAHPGMPFVTLNQSFAWAKHLSVGMINSDMFSDSGSSWNPSTSTVFWVGAVLMGHWWVLTDSAILEL